MTLLVNQTPQLVVPCLAECFGVQEAVLLQQLHYRLLQQGKDHNGKRWYCQSYEHWSRQLPYWNEQKIKRLFAKLVKVGIVLKTDKLNRFYIDRTSWYTIDYDALQNYLEEHQDSILSRFNEPTTRLAVNNEQSQLSFCECSEQMQVTSSQQINIGSTKKDFQDVPQERDWQHQIDAVLSYLNEKTGKHFKLKTKSNRKLISARLNDGFTVQDCYTVIDTQVANWLHDERMRIYLRPQTLFRPANFESYLNNAKATKFQKQPDPQEVVLDFEEDEALLLADTFPQPPLHTAENTPRHMERENVARPLPQNKTNNASQNAKQPEMQQRVKLPKQLPLPRPQITNTKQPSKTLKTQNPHK